LVALSTYERFRAHPFVRWNKVIAQAFFNESRANQQVWLSATPPMLKRLGATVGGSLQDLVAVLLEGPPWVSHRSHMCANALASADAWRAFRFPYPPYVHYLGLFAAAGTQDNVAVRTNAYYPRLWAMLGTPNRRGTPPGFERMAVLWADLEKWSNVDKNGDLGRFTVGMIGERRHIGLPLAQNLLLPAERAALPPVFGSSPPGRLDGDVIAELVGSSTAAELSRVRTLLRTAHKADQVLLRELLVDAYARWVASLGSSNGPGALSGRPTPARALPGAPLPIKGELRLTLHLDRVARTARMAVRCFTPDFPQMPVRLRAATGQVLECEEESDGWSTELERAGEAAVDALAFGDWRSGLIMTAEGLDYQFARAGAKIAVFTSGAAWGLPGLLEARELETGQPVHLLTHNSCWARLEAWAGGDSGLVLVECGGLPDGWRLAHLENTPSPDSLRDLLPWLHPPSPPRLALSGGLRARPGNHHQYLAFAPPAIRLTGTAEKATYWVGSSRVALNSEKQLLIPVDLRKAGPVQLRATNREGHVIANANLELVTEPFSRARLEQASGSVASRKPFRGTRDLMLVPEIAALFEFVQGRPRHSEVTLLDRSGQSTLWSPHGALPQGFRPVWAAIPGPPAHVVYCGSASPQFEEPTDVGSGCGSGWRSHVLQAASQPPLPLGAEPVERLWRQYVLAASR
jgi:hypothetical protein